MSSFLLDQFGIDVSSHNLFAFLTRICVFLDCSVHFLNVMVSIPRVGKVHAHQHDALMVDRDRCCNGPFADVFSVIDSFSPFLVEWNSKPVFLLIFSCSYEDVPLMRLPNF